MAKNVKNTTLPSVWDLLAPHSCRGCGRIGMPLCERCKNYIIAEHATYKPKLPKELVAEMEREFGVGKGAKGGVSGKMGDGVRDGEASGKTGDKVRGGEMIFVLGPRTGLVGRMVHDLKYDSVRALARPLAELLDATLPEIKGAVSIVPLPTSTKHVRARGLDHTLMIAKQLAKLRGYRVERLLVRAKNTTQVGASGAQRRVQAAKAYEVRAGARVAEDTTYLLLDDVWTTGASMQAALEKFRTLGPRKVRLVLLARN